MKTRSMILALGLVAVSGVAAAADSAHVANVQGRSGIPAVHAGATIVTRTAAEVVPGPTTEEGPVAVAVGTAGYEINVYGRS